ncbi:MAG: DUF3078 domain-containing protein [Bacteroidales bacterium]|nr:DUF3078 domain-containing protein [Bacteroidales bacterium]
MKPIKLLILLLMAGMPLIGIGQTEVPASQVKEEIKRVEKENEKEAKEAARKVAREEQKNAKTEWDKGVTTSIAFSQVSFTNWAAGGDGNLSLNGFANLHANLKKGIHYWNNSLNLGYGLIKNNGDILKKSDDKIIFESKYGYSLNKYFGATAVLTGRTQFSNGYDYSEDPKALVSSFLAPGYFAFGVGFDIIPLNWMSFNVAPLVEKLTVVRLPELQTIYGNDSAQVCKFALGAQLKFDLKKEVFKNVEVTSNLTLFNDYLDHQWFDVKVQWDLYLIMKINKFLSANITTNLIWDSDILTTDTNDDGIKDAARVQFKELLGVGLTFSF